jgi:hypothetical protein
LFNSATPLYFLVGPFLFFHVRSVLTDCYEISRKDAWHFIPAFLVLLNIFPHLMLSSQEKLELARSIQNDLGLVTSLEVNWLLSYVTVVMVRPVFTMLYAVAGAYMLHSFSRTRTFTSPGPLPSSQVSSTFNWLLFFCGAVFILALGNLLMGYFFIFYPNLRPLNITILLQALVVFAIPVSLLFFPQVLYGIPVPAYFSSEANPGPQEKRKEPEAQMSFDRLAIQVREVMEREKPFLQTDFTLDDLARLMKVPKHHLYYCLNEVMKVKFVDLRTELRVAHAKEL